MKNKLLLSQGTEILALLQDLVFPPTDIHSNQDPPQFGPESGDLDSSNSIASDLMCELKEAFLPLKLHLKSKRVGSGEHFTVCISWNILTMLPESS